MLHLQTVQMICSDDSSLTGPPLGKPTLVVRADSAAGSSPLARAPETRSPLSSERDNMAPSARAVGSSLLTALLEPTSLPERVLNTISEARALSSKGLYALKVESAISTWCLGENLSTSELSVVLYFLQELFPICTYSVSQATEVTTVTEYVFVL